MNIPGSIDAELKAAREEGRREGLREALEACKRQAYGANVSPEEGSIEQGCDYCVVAVNDILNGADSYVSFDLCSKSAWEEGRKEGKAEALAIIRARISDLASINDHWAPHHFRALREIAKEIEAEE